MKILNHCESLLEMATVGTTDDKYEIVIFTNDPGNIAHFHYRDSQTRGQEFHTCIKIEKAEYFHHTGKEDVLNSSQRKELVKFLNEPYHNKRFNGTNWHYLLNLWNNENNSNLVVDEDLVMPDYRQL